ncbi:MAG: hypothetical protein WCP20_19060 [Desulfuromonadales bacterium]
MIVSPEFRRNLWLEITTYRLISMPVILGAVIFLVYVFDNYRLDKGVSSASAGLFFIISMIWGTKLASESIMIEIRDHTWDGQRMSVITPWQLTWGKLFGSTVYTWYGALICIGFFGLSSTERDAGQTLKTMLVLILSGVMAHAVSLLASLMAIQKERAFNKSQSPGLLILGIVAAGPFINLALNKGTAVRWFGVSFSETDFLLGSILAYALWAVLGVCQMLRRELQMKNGPWVWYGFVLFIMLHIAGFFYGFPQGGNPAMSAASPALLAAYGISVCVIYFMAFCERKDIITLQAVVRLASEGDWRRFLERSPRWFLTLPVAVLAGCAVLLAAVTGNAGKAAISWFVVASLFFIMRDVGIMLFCNLGKSNRRADILSLLYLILLYGVFPATLSGMKIDDATLLFWPRPDLNPIVACVAPLLELLAIGFLVAGRWKKRTAE